MHFQAVQSQSLRARQLRGHQKVLTVWIDCAERLQVFRVRLKRIPFAFVSVDGATATWNHKIHFTLLMVAPE